MTLLRNNDYAKSINFQKASCTLDGCVKIWTSRVDSVGVETTRLLSGLANDPRSFYRSFSSLCIDSCDMRQEARLTRMRKDRTRTRKMTKDGPLSKPKRSLPHPSSPLLDSRTLFHSPPVKPQLSPTHSRN